MKKIIVLSILMIVVAGWSYPSGWRSEVMIVGDDNHYYGHCCVTTDDENRIHIAFRKLETGDPFCYDLDYHRSTNTGLNWTKYSLPAGGTAPVEYQSTDICAIDDTVLIVYQKYSDVYFVKGTDGGTTWPSQPTLISDGDDTSEHPCIAVDDSLLQVIFADNDEDGSTYEIYHSKSTDYGDNWPADQPVTDATRNSWHPAMTINNSAMHTVWSDNRLSNENYEIYYNRSTDHGTNWVYSNDLRLSQDTLASEDPDMACNGDTVHVVWSDQKTNPGPGIYYRRSTNNGSIWQTSYRLASDGNYPAIATYNSGVYVVWQKDDNETTHIYYRESSDRGSTWGSVTKITNSNDSDSFPDIYADDLGRHVVLKNRDSYLFFRIIA